MKSLLESKLLKEIKDLEEFDRTCRTLFSVTYFDKEIDEKKKDIEKLISPEII